jgi:hypothetical protein
VTDLQFRILGPIEVVGAAGAIRLGGRRQRAVLAILLLRANQVVPVERLADDLYGGGAPATAVGQVRDHVSQLRKALDVNGDGTAASPLERRPSFARAMRLPLQRGCAKRSASGADRLSPISRTTPSRTRRSSGSRSFG